MSARRKFRVSLLVMFLLVASIWGIIFAVPDCTTDNANREVCKRPLKPHLGLDLQGGIAVVLTAEGEASTASIDKAVDIIRSRVDALGVAEPDISRQGNNVLIQLPGIEEQDKALRVIGTTAKLEFRAVLEVLTPGTEPFTKATPPDCRDPNTYPEGDPTKEVVQCVRDKDPATGRDQPRETWIKLRLGPVVMGGSDVSGATAVLPTETGSAGSWTVDLSLNGEGGKKFEAVTGQLACNQEGDPKRQLAIVLDRVVESHPQMGTEVQCRQGISGGSAQITGSFTEADAKDLALVLRYGALPVAFEPSTVTTVSPTLGKDSLRGGLIAGAIGLAIVFVYLLLFYRGLGLLAWLGIAMHGAFTIGVVIILGKTAGFALTLAGIAGLIVSLGIAADSFIVYFERIKDEVHGGKSVRASIDRAWSSAWRTIVAADLVTALAAFVLYMLAVGSVRGFALMLGLATGLDLFVSYLFMHPSVWLLAQTRAFNASRTFGIRRVVGEAAAPAASGGAR